MTQPYLYPLDGGLPVKCKACAFRSTATDDDPETGKYSVELAWGRNAMGGQIDESHVDGYNVWIVDMYGRNGQLLTPLGVPKKMTATDCCDPLEYQVVVTGSWPSSGNMVGFAVMPYQSVALPNNGGHEHVQVPKGIYFDGFVDKIPEAGTVVTKVTQQVGMTVSSCADGQKLRDSPSADGPLRGAFSAGTGIERRYVSVSDKTLENCNSGGRRLQNTNPTLKATFQVILPSDYSGVYEQSTLNANTFQSTLNTLVTESGDPNLANVVVSDVAAAGPSLNPVTVDTPTDGARPLAPLATSCIALVLALAGRTVA